MELAFTLSFAAVLKAWVLFCGDFSHGLCTQFLQWPSITFLTNTGVLLAKMTLVLQENCSSQFGFGFLHCLLFNVYALY